MDGLEAATDYFGVMSHMSSAGGLMNKRRITLKEFLSEMGDIQLGFQQWVPR